MTWHHVQRALPTASLLVVAALLLGSGAADPYPLDGETATGIRRLQGYRNAQAASGLRKLPPGALLGTDEVRLNLAGINESWDLATAAKDPQLTAALEAIFMQRDPSYAVAVVDITDPANIVWGGVREDTARLPGSVGKVTCMVAFFDGLRRAFPDLSRRQQVLRERLVTAEDWAVGDPHEVPKYDPATGRNQFRFVTLGDRFNLAEWLDHMISASANSAGSTVWKEAMLLRHFGAAYPPSLEEEHRFFEQTPPGDLSKLSQLVINEPLVAAGIDPTGLQQGTFWTKAGQRRVPGIRSFATARELVRFLLRLEQGRLVDRWSSREMKRYLYMTKKRYRYAFAPELSNAAVYFKSGSFYRCTPEEGYYCGKYRGNAENLMNSIAIVESPAQPGPDQKRYLVALTSNVLRINSAWDHSLLGAAIEAVIRTRKPVVVQDLAVQGTEAQLQEVGASN